MQGRSAIRSTQRAKRHKPYDVPAWFVVLALCLVAVWPFLSRPGLPRETDAELHVFRVAELAHLMRQGVWYPRWASDFYYGYGYPLFHFYGPLTYYLAAGFAALPAVNIIGGVKAVFVLGVALSGLGMYAFARDRWGALGGLLAAAAYVYAPYLLLFDPYLRGNLAECFTFGIIPWVLWAFGRLVSGGGRRYLVGVAIGWAALLTTHNVMAALLSALLLVYAAFEWLVRRERRALVVGALALVLGLGISAFYWLPVLAERRFVQSENIVQGYFDFHDHFLTLGELFGPARISDQGATFPEFRFNIGLGQVILVGLALLLLLYKFIRAADRRGQTRLDRENPAFIRDHLSSITFWLAVTLGLLFFMLPVSVPLWEAIRPLAYVQFPWKLLGPMALAMAVLAGALPWLARELGGRPLAVAVTAGGLLLVWLAALPNTFPPVWKPNFGGVTVLDHLHFERQGRAVGTTSAAEYLPIWVKDSPGPSAWLIDAFEEGRSLNKLDPASLPAGAQVVDVAHGPTTDRFVVESPQSFRAKVFTFYFPGWQAHIDDEPIEIVPHGRHGFITVQMPAGRHTLDVRFGDTPPRTAGAVISALSLLGVVVGVLSIRPSARAQQVSPLESWRPLLVLVLVLFIAKVVVVDRQPNWFRFTSTGFEARPAQHKLQVNFSDQVMLLGYDLPQAEVVSGDQVPLTLYWKAIQPVPINYSVFVHLVRPPEHQWGQDDRLNPADFPMTRWPTDKYVRDQHRLPVLPGTPPGEYEIEVGFYQLDSGERLFVFKAQEAAGGVRLPTKVQVMPPQSPPPVESLAIGHRTDTPVGDGLTLLGWSLNAEAFTPPDFAHLTLFWRVGRDALGDLVFAVTLLDEAGGVVDELYGPVDGFYPTSRWQRGEIVRDQYAFWLAKDMVPGRYRVELRALGESWPVTEVEIQVERP